MSRKIVADTGFGAVELHRNKICFNSARPEAGFGLTFGRPKRPEARR